MPEVQETNAASPPQLRVGVLLMHQFTLAAFSGFIDVLRLAGDSGGRSRQLAITWQVMSLDGRPRASSAGIEVSDITALQAPENFDYIVLCGGNDYHQRMPSDGLYEWLQRAVDHKVRMLGLCTGTFALAYAGLIGTRTVCVHWNVLDSFRQQFPGIRAVVDRIFVDEGDLITCAGSTAAIDVALYLVERHCGRDKAQQAIRHMMLQGIRSPRLPQAHFYNDLEGVEDPRVRKAAHYIEQRIDNPPSLEAIARYVGVSGRQLGRAFQAALGESPMAFYRRLRLGYGRWLLEHGHSSITQVAMDCGYADGAHFSRDFRSHYGETPSHFLKHGGAEAMLLN